MHLKSITMKGFKSFPDRTSLAFGPGISVVVGPNGSGKSNITDAVADAFEPQIERAIGSVYDFKSELQERLARRGELVAYRVVSEEGPPHDRMFETVAEVGGEQLGAGSGRSKKESEQEAARTALAALDEDEARADG